METLVYYQVFPNLNAFHEYLNNKTVKHLSLELIIIMSYCFLGIHSWLGEAQKTTSAIQEQSNVMIFFFFIWLHKWAYFIFDASFWFMPYAIGKSIEEWFSVFYCLPLWSPKD